MEDILNNPYIQYGFAGISLALVGVLSYVCKIWHNDIVNARRDAETIRKELIGLVQKNTEVIARSLVATESLQKTVEHLIGVIEENTKLLYQNRSGGGKR